MSSHAHRQRAYKRRQHQGGAIIMVEIDVVAIEDMLERFGCCLFGKSTPATRWLVRRISNPLSERSRP